MKLIGKHIPEFNQSLEALGVEDVHLKVVEAFPGATTYSPRSVVVWHFDSANEELVSAAAEEAARMLGTRIGIVMTWGVRSETVGQIVSWLEYFPGGADYTGILATVQAMHAAYTVVAATRSGDKAHQQVAQRETRKLDETPFKKIFVQSQFLVAAARREDIPVYNIGTSDSAWHFGWGSQSDIFYTTGALADSIPGHQITWRKNLAKKMFEEIGLPTPRWRAIGEDEDAFKVAEKIGWPCVVKPLNRAFGTGVTAAILTRAELDAAVAAARQYSSHIIIEAHEPGMDHRLMVVDGRLIGAARREPPFVTGDGKKTVDALLADLNRDRDGTRDKGYLLPVEHDEALDATLQSQGLSLESVLPKGRILQLRSIANFSTGGSVTDVTNDVHPQIRGLAELLATSLGLRTAGIDYITQDISRSHAEVGGGFIEVNAMPRLRLLMADNNAEEDIGTLVLGQKPGRIPVTLMVGNSEALAELTEPVKRRTAAVAGAAAVAPTWTQIGAVDMPRTGLEPFGAVSAALRHLSVDQLVILWSAEQIDRLGLPVDKLDRAIVIGAEIDPSRLSGFCREIVAAKDAAKAFDAAFAPPKR